MAQPTKNLLDAANRVVMNKDYELEVPAPEKFDAKKGVQLTLSMKDQREHGVVARMAYEVDGLLYIQDTVMASNGDTKEVWKRGKQPLVLPT